MEKFTLLISPATSEYNNKNFCNYDTTINVFIDDIAEDGFLSLQVGNENDTDEFYVNFVNVIDKYVGEVYHKNIRKTPIW